MELTNEPGPPSLGELEKAANTLCALGLYLAKTGLTSADLKLLQQCQDQAILIAPTVHLLRRTCQQVRLGAEIPVQVDCGELIEAILPGDLSTPSS